MKMRYVLKNFNTGSCLTYDPVNPPVYMMEWITIRDGELVLERSNTSELPELVKEFLENLTKRSPGQDGRG